ncbi:MULTISPECIES: bifunctional diguanylate cyclase/phosphodiesterase [Rubrivivax]|uniref:EAL domain-containing protein n=1 Tax=Rubrivivax benzoatilyticus TaxID=316997 RepID=A0ABX0HXY2_9BURK|nr:MULTISPECIES: EAL domain-containing protein [Rubrivivax]EGJ08913.1 sensory box/response regulator [Rubrivivax benzoatilyticus JA2 = ATCC BAA-35]NHK99862.1 EAL domain-containing protein [Rubrivivax benzoatilyticus]NHL25859.1 EAL domain-containing protein [Rubrivivax benzoatilyticus]
MRAPAHGPIPPRRDDAALLARPEVLLVDDDEVGLLTTAIALRERGFAIVEATRGEEALAILRDRKPDLVVLDAQMPGLDGFETCARIRALPGFERLPIVMLTGLDDEASIKHAFDVHATDFYTKDKDRALNWSLLARRLEYVLRAARTTVELDRNREKLARAQQLARMGSFEWRQGGGLTLSREALEVLRVGGRPPTLRSLLRRVPRALRLPSLRLLRDRVAQRRALDQDLTLDDGLLVVHVAGKAEEDEHKRFVGYDGFLQDITDRHRAQSQSRYHAAFDMLTELPNRREFIRRANLALEASRQHGLRHRVALLQIDLDRFKQINDTLGHQVGDEVLREVATRLRGCIRYHADIDDSAVEAAGPRAHRDLETVGRVGGDEFVVLLPEVTDPADAERVAQRIVLALREPMRLAGVHDRVVTGSVGVALFPDDGETVQELHRNADLAMYEAKKERDSSMVYGPGLLQRPMLEAALPGAAGRGELELHYQPQVDVASGRLVGVEALMRWRFNGRLVMPGDFIPLAEESGDILGMSEWALREAAAQARRWQADFGFDGTIAVNLPPKLFLRNELIDLIDQLTSDGGGPRRLLSLEITETSLMRDVVGVGPALRRLHQIGVDVSIDDFGTGYSSLSHLSGLHCAELKIDRSFVAKLGIEPTAVHIVRTIIALARHLSLRVIAEGVETEHQVELLHSLECTRMQGYHIGRPVPAPQFEHWFATMALPLPAAAGAGLAAAAHDR